MVVADINIVCMNQIEKKHIIPRACIDYYDTSSMCDECIYIDRYQKIQDVKGIWYQIYPQARVGGDYRQEFMDLHIENGKYKVIFLDVQLKENLISFLKNIYKDSPLKSMYFFVDLQGYEENFVYIGYAEFIQVIQKEELCFNTVYCIGSMQEI